MQLVQVEVQRLESVINGSSTDSSVEESDDSLPELGEAISRMQAPRTWLDEGMEPTDSDMASVHASTRAMSDVDTVMGADENASIEADDEDMPLMALDAGDGGKRSTTSQKVTSRRLKMARGITIDPGAADPVMPRRMVRGNGNKIRPSAASRAGVHYISASANRIRNEGETDLHFETGEGHAMKWTFQVAEVNKVLASVSYLVDNNYRVLFEKDGNTGRDISFILNKATGKSIKMKRERNVWTIDSSVTEDAGSSFTRPETVP